MEKLKMQTPNIANENYKKLAEMFPNAVTESIDENGEVVRAIDKDVLMQEISCKVVEGREERYQFTWPDKKKSMLLANLPISKTLRPVGENETIPTGADAAGSTYCSTVGVDFDNTENLYIEGDNLEVLKLLQETYLSKIKMIYIDPPYNTGNNIIYKNDFSESIELYTKRNNEFDSNGCRLVQNTESNGRFHTDWLNMMYPVLRFARNFLTSDGYISIAIDDNELYNLKKVTDEAFGESNYIGTVVTRCNPQGRGKNNLDPVHEYHLLYAKNLSELPLLRIKKMTINKEYSYLMRSGTNSRKFERPLRFYPILVKDNKISMISREEYSKIYSLKTGFDDLYISKLKKEYESLGYTFVLPISKDGEKKVWQRTFERVCSEYQTYIFEKGQVKVPSETDRTPISLWTEDIYSNVSNGTNRLKKLFNNGTIPFDFSKSIFTVKDLISLNTCEDDIILDFFSGSATTAHAVMQLNAEDGGNRKFIMVQIPEPCDEKSEACKAGYKNICEIGKERIRRAGKKIKEDNKDKQNIDSLDIGFRVLKCDSSNMKDVYYDPSNYEQKQLNLLYDNIKKDRTSEDLLFQVMLDLGVLLSSKIEETQICGKRVFTVAPDLDKFLVACFDADITDEVVKKIAEMHPYYAVFCDKGMKSDSTMANFDQIFDAISPTTIRKVL